MATQRPRNIGMVDLGYHSAQLRTSVLQEVNATSSTLYSANQGFGARREQLCQSRNGILPRYGFAEECAFAGNPSGTVNINCPAIKPLRTTYRGATLYFSAISTIKSIFWLYAIPWLPSSLTRASDDYANPASMSMKMATPGSRFATGSEVTLAIVTGTWCMRSAVEIG